MRRDPIQQVAFFVPDIRAAALAHSALYGSGPYFIADHIEVSSCRYRGVPGLLDHSAAFGQWGDVMIEFVQQHSLHPSVYLEKYPNGGPGFHHVALIVDNLNAAIRHYEEHGFPEAFYAEAVNGTRFAFMDTVKDYGHFTELYEPAPPLMAVYDLVRNAAKDFNGENVIRAFPS